MAALATKPARHGERRAASAPRERLSLQVRRKNMPAKECRAARYGGKRTVQQPSSPRSHLSAALLGQRSKGQGSRGARCPRAPHVTGVRPLREADRRRERHRRSLIERDGGREALAVKALHVAKELPFFGFCCLSPPSSGFQRRRLRQKQLRRTIRNLALPALCGRCSLEVSILGTDC